MFKDPYVVKKAEMEGTKTEEGFCSEMTNVPPKQV